jgi:hypothetical protein
VRGRSITILAIGALWLDGVLLLLAGLRIHRTSLVVLGASCLVAGVLVWLYWRRYRRLIQELTHERAALSREAEEFRRLLRGEPS